MEIQYYQPPLSEYWQGRQDNEMVERLHQSIQLSTIEAWLKRENLTQTVVFAGFECDSGIQRNQGRIGAAAGPNTLRKALANTPLHGSLSELNVFDLGNVSAKTESLDKLQLSLGHLVDAILAKSAFPIILGGGHETAWGHYLGLHEQYRQRDLAIINFDAHFDLRPKLTDGIGTSGSSFLQIAEYRKESLANFNYYCLGISQASNTQSLFQTAHQWQVQYLTCTEIMKQPRLMHTFVKKIIEKHEVIYVSVCLDVFNAAFAPGVSAVQPDGLYPWHVGSTLRQLASSGKVIALDIVELSPQYDINDMTAKLGALLIAEFLYHFKSGVRA